MAKFPEMLKELRKRNGLTQAQLGERVGFSRATISMYEIGERNPDLESLEILADFFNIDIDTLVGRKPLNVYITIEERELLKQLSAQEQKDLLIASRNASPQDIEMVKEILEHLKRR
mgnify:CR=1 FL=1